MTRVGEGEFIFFKDHHRSLVDTFYSEQIHPDCIAAVAKKLALENTKLTPEFTTAVYHFQRKEYAKKGYGRPNGLNRGRLDDLTFKFLYAEAVPEACLRRKVAGKWISPIVTRGIGVAGSKATNEQSVTFDKIYSGHHALVVGVNEYKSPDMTKLGGAVRDAKAISALLKEQGFKVKSYSTNKRPAAPLKKRYGPSPKMVKQNDRVIIFFAEHGVSDGPADGKMGYLMTHESDPQLPEDAGIVHWLQRNLNRMKAKHVMFIADACYSGIAIRTRGNPMPTATPDYVAEITKRDVRLTMTAGTDGQEAMEYQGHGLFTYFLLDALRGAADRDRDGFITSTEISQHLKTQVPPIGKASMKNGQVPQTGRMGQVEMVFRTQIPAQK